MIRQSSRSAFTLLEIAVSIGILTVGLTAVVVVYYTGVRWAHDAKVDFSAYSTARSVYENASILKNHPDFPDSAQAHNLSDECKGYINGFYVVRSITKETELENKAGTITEVEILVYDGGTDANGEQVAKFSGKLYVPYAYANVVEP
ncbi:MAG: type II secretion system protein [Planctomycetes bacterium]|nr:type II secretion system protein [Planctomycetota bacterium]